MGVGCGGGTVGLGRLPSSGRLLSTCADHPLRGPHALGTGQRVRATVEPHHMAPHRAHRAVVERLGERPAGLRHTCKVSLPHAEPTDLLHGYSVGGQDRAQAKADGQRGRLLCPLDWPFHHHTMLGVPCHHELVELQKDGTVLVADGVSACRQVSTTALRQRRHCNSRGSYASGGCAQHSLLRPSPPLPAHIHGHIWWRGRLEHVVKNPHCTQPEG